MDAKRFLVFAVITWICTSPAAGATEGKKYPVPADSADKDWFSAGQQELEDALRVTQNTNVAKNVVFFLGDGMGLINVWASRIYAGQSKHGQSGEEHQLLFETFPRVALAKTYNEDRQIPDSAGTATAFLAGVKANSGTVGVTHNVTRGNCSNAAENAVTSILDWSKAEGKSTGIVTSARVTHATPAGAYAHSPERYWENDAMLRISLSGIPREYNLQFDCRDIAAQLIEDNWDINVVMGGGRQNFRSNNVIDEEYGSRYKRVDGQDLIQEWNDKHSMQNNAHAFVWNKQQLDAVDTANTDYLLGLFEPDHMQYESLRNVTTEPSLAEMTRKALQILQKNDNGYFLLVEGGRIDHAHHEGRARMALEETVAMDDAVRVVMEMTSRDDTLVVVTADHSHAFVSGGRASRGNDILGLTENLHDVERLDKMPFTTLLYGNGPGGVMPGNVRQNLTDVDTRDVNYKQQAAVPLKDETHGGEDVPIYAVGPMAHLFHGVHEQNYIAHVMAYASCVGENKRHCAHKHANSAVHATAGSTAAVGTALTLFLTRFVLGR